MATSTLPGILACLRSDSNILSFYYMLMHSSLHRSDVNDGMPLRVHGRADMGAGEGQYGFK